MSMINALSGLQFLVQSIQTEGGDNFVQKYRDMDPQISELAGYSVEQDLMWVEELRFQIEQVEADLRKLAPYVLEAVGVNVAHFLDRLPVEEKK